MSYYRKQKFRRRQIVILLGAGSAMAWDSISSATIKKMFIEDVHFGKITVGRVELTLGEYVFKLLDDFYQADNSNFETFLAVLEALLNYTINSSKTGGINPQNTSYFSVVYKLNSKIELITEGKTDTEKSEYCFNLFSYYVDIVLANISEYNTEVTIKDKFTKGINADLIDFVKFFLVRNYSIKFYTLNYDNIVPQILSSKFHVYEGIHKSIDADGLFNFNLNRFESARVTHFNLHGSIFLHQIRYGLKIETVYNYTSQTMPVYALEMRGGNPSEPLIFSPIITGYNKTQRINSEPFNLGHTAFVNDCNNCHALLTVGYSFSDPHINSILSSFVCWDKTKFINVTKAGDNYKNEREYNTIYHDICQLDGCVEDSNWIKSSNNRRYIYKNCFDNFLKDKDNWKSIL